MDNAKLMCHFARSEIRIRFHEFSQSDAVCLHRPTRPLLIFSAVIPLVKALELPTARLIGEGFCPIYLLQLAVGVGSGDVRLKEK
jgi:hypothetical protein